MHSTSANGPAFSVIMPLYNQEQFVAESIQSILDQTFGDWELIIIDDGSTDRSGAIAESFAAKDDRITVLHQANAGCAGARKTGIARATGTWLAYLDSDDLWFPDTLASYAAHIEQHPEAEFVYGYRHRLNEDGTVTELPARYQDRPTGTADLFERMYLSHLCVAYRRELYDKVGGYDPALRNADDYDMYLRMSLHCRFEPIGRPTGQRRRHAGCLSQQTGYSRMLEGEVLRRFVEHRGGGELLDADRVARRLGKLYYSAGRQYFKARCYREAIAAIRTAHRYRRTIKSVGVGLLSRCLLPFGRRDERDMPAL